MTKSYLVLFVYAPVLSSEIICTYFPCHSHDAVQKQLYRLERSGYIEHRYISRADAGKKSRDSRTKQVYTMTPEGYRHIKSELPQNAYYLNVCGTKHLMHYYSCANAFLSFLTSGMKIDSYCIEERTENKRNRIDHNYKKCTDAVCNMGSMTYYIIQYTDRRRADILRYNLDHYSRRNYVQPLKPVSPIIVLLFKEPHYSPVFEPRYDMDTLEKIIPILADRDISQFAVSPDINDHGPDIKATVSDFIYHTLVEECLYFKGKDIRNYINDFKMYKNKYYTYDYNYHQEYFTDNKRWDLIYEYYRNYISCYITSMKTQELYESVQRLICCDECYMFSSTLFRNLFPYIYDMKANHEKVLDGYVHNYVYEGRHVFNDNNVINFRNGDSCRNIITPVLKNCYLVDNQIVAFEYPDINLSSFLRILHLRCKYYGSHLTIILCVLNLFNAQILSNKFFLLQEDEFDKTAQFKGYNFYFLDIEEFSRDNPRLYTLDKHSGRQYVDGLYQEEIALFNDWLNV